MMIQLEKKWQQNNYNIKNSYKSNDCYNNNLSNNKDNDLNVNNKDNNSNSKTFNSDIDFEINEESIIRHIFEKQC